MLFPITLVMVSQVSVYVSIYRALTRSNLIQILVGLLRHYVTMLLNSAPKKLPAAEVREQ